MRLGQKTTWLLAISPGIVGGLLLGGASPKSYAPPDYLAAVLTVNTPNYTGGLTHSDQAIADRIHVALLSRYYVDCDPSSPFAGELISLGKAPDSIRLPSLDGVDPDLAFLIRALDNPNQEVRDVAAYTIGLLGPSAKVAQLFLEKKFSTIPIRGGWYNFALQNVSCQHIRGPYVANAIPAEVRSTNEFANATDPYVVASLYLDPDVKYPPGLLTAAFQQIGPAGNSAGPLIAKILENDALGAATQAEAAQALSEIAEVYSQDALPTLIHLADSKDENLRFYVGKALVRLRNERAIGLLVDWIRDDDWNAEWSSELCRYGAKAIVAEDKLIEVSHHSSLWPSVAQRIAETLGCIGSVKAIPTLTSMLDAPDWALNIAAAKALGQIGRPDKDAVATLERLSKTHWSARVKKSAFNALTALGKAETPASKFPDSVRDDAESEVLGGPYPFDHGLPWCDDTARYSIDGKNWFIVKWIQPTLQAVPRGFRPKTNLLIQKVGTQTFLRVGDGWLFGSSGFESEGVLAHVSTAGAVTEMEGWPGSPFGQASITGIMKVGGRYFASGYEILKIGPAGVLLELNKEDNGKWASKRAVVLPSPPWSHAIAPGGELLLSDGPNDYAVVDNRIVPLKCERTLPGSYFSRH